jgi:predicted butyrate kinase (DUF1464 family)
MTRVAGADPGTSSLDLLILADGVAQDQCRFSPSQLQGDAALPARWLAERGPFDLIAGPSGYGLPLVSAHSCTEHELALMTLVRPDERGRNQGVLGFATVVRALCMSGLPVLFLPGVIHLPTVPAHRKHNRVDLGTADKLCVAALALAQAGARKANDFSECRFCLVELGTAFTACLVVDGGRVVDGLGGTSGPVGWGSAGAWDGETAYLLSPLSKGDLFAGGASAADVADRAELLSESVLKAVAGLQAVTSVAEVVLSGRLLETEPAVAQAVAAALARLGSVNVLRPLPGAWVKQAAQGAAVLADGLAGGKHRVLVDSLAVRQATGTALSWLRHPRADEVRHAFGVSE